MVSIHHRVRGATVDLLCRSRLADKQAGRVRMSDQFVNAFSMVASGLRSVSTSVLRKIPTGAGKTPPARKANLAHGLDDRDVSAALGSNVR